MIYCWRLNASNESFHLRVLILFIVSKSTCFLWHSKSLSATRWYTGSYRVPVFFFPYDVNFYHNTDADGQNMAKGTLELFQSGPISLLHLRKACWSTWTEIKMEEIMKKLCKREERFLFFGNISVWKSPVWTRYLITINVVKLRLLLLFQINQQLSLFYICSCCSYNRLVEIKKKLCHCPLHLYYK